MPLAGDWTIDLKKQIAIHDSGFIVFLSNDTGNWEAWRTNSATWIKTDFAERAPLVPQMTRAAVVAYDEAYKKSKPLGKR